MCIDYIPLNRITKTGSYPLPLIAEILSSFGGARFFTNIDLFSGYHQIAMAEESIPYTAFVTKFGQFNFTCMLFGLTGAPHTFQAAMDQLFCDLQGCVTMYLDNINVYSPTVERHLEDLEKVFKKIQQANLSINGAKLTLCAEQAKLLGHVISAAGKQRDPEKIKAITSWPQPRDAKEVLSFLGTVNYYHFFVPNFSNLARPL